MCNTKVGVLLYTGSETWLFSDGDWAVQSQVSSLPRSLRQRRRCTSSLSRCLCHCLSVAMHCCYRCLRACNLLPEAPQRSRHSARGRSCSAARGLLEC
jgi:hypothetical protein